MANYTYEQRVKAKPILEKMEGLCRLAIDDIYISPNSDDFHTLIEGIQDLCDELKQVEVINETETEQKK